MASIEETLNAMSDTDYLHDKIQFLINEDLRTIAIPANGVVLGVQGDKYVNRVNFQMSRYYNGFDMSEFETAIIFINANSNAGFYAVDDITVEGDTLYFTWIIGPSVASYIGDVEFAVRMTRIGEGQNDRIFNTTIGKAKVIEGLNIDNFIPEEDRADILSRVNHILSVKSEIDEQYLAIQEINRECAQIKSDTENIKNETNDIKDITGNYMSDTRDISISSKEQVNKAAKLVGKAKEYLDSVEEVAERIGKLTEYPIDYELTDSNGETITYEQNGESYPLEHRIIYMVLGDNSKRGNNGLTEEEINDLIQSTVTSKLGSSY